MITVTEYAELQSYNPAATNDLKEHILASLH